MHPLDRAMDQARADQAAETCRAFARFFRTEIKAEDPREDFLKKVAAVALDQMAYEFEQTGKLEIDPAERLTVLTTD